MYPERVSTCKNISPAEHPDMKNSLSMVIGTALLALISWTSYGQKQKPSSTALSSPLPVSWQKSDRIIDWQPVRIMSEAKVLEIVDVKVAEKSITIGQPFAANDDWLDALTFRIRNISGKTINLLGFGVGFPELTANGGVTPMFSITYSAESVKRDSAPQKPLMPGEETDLKLPEDQLAIMRRVGLRTIGTANLSKVNILPGLVTFDDGSRAGGFSLRRRVSN
jgi:hypothetical protein